MSNIRSLVFLVLIVTSQTGIAKDTWVAQKSGDNIETFLKEVEGSKYKAAKHVALINASLDELAEAMGDGSSCSDWLSLCLSAKKIREISASEYLGYAVIDMPWPFADRDIVYRSTTNIDPVSGAISVRQVSEPESYPPSQFTRMDSKNTFYIEPLGAQRLRLTWVVHSNPGGKVPANLVNAKIHKNTRRDLLSLMQVLDREH